MTKKEFMEKIKDVSDDTPICFVHGDGYEEDITQLAIEQRAIGTYFDGRPITLLSATHKVIRILGVNGVL